VELRGRRAAEGVGEDVFDDGVVGGAAAVDGEIDQQLE
jgi:hypothetical protein